MIEELTIESLRFVKGAVGKKDFQPALTHFRIKDGRVMGYNGIIALSSPIDIEITATPKAVEFIKAIERCKYDTTVLHLTPGGKLSVKSGPFRVLVNCVEDSHILDAIQPAGVEIDFKGSLLETLRILEPYVGTDASRPWATGIYFHNRSAYATNNIVIAEYWVGQEMPSVNLPSSAVDELLRLYEEPEKVWMHENSMTFFFKGDKWLRTQLLNTDWPMELVMTVLDLPAELREFPDEFFFAVEAIAPFVGEEGKIYLRDGFMSTSCEEGEGAVHELKDLPERGAFHHKHLLSLRDVADKIDFSKHPQPCPWRAGDRLRGVIQGMVDA
jgi:hypothetical protein